MSWAEFSSTLASSPIGNRGRIFLPWYESEITPAVLKPGVHRYGLEENDAAGHVRAVIEAQMMALARHSRWMGVEVDTIYATGGAAANVQILQVMADVFDAEVYQLEIGNSAALGAALRAHHADAAASGAPVSWEEAIAKLVEPVAASRLSPQAGAAAVYSRLMEAHAACEAHALGSGPDPSPLLARLAVTLAGAT